MSSNSITNDDRLGIVLEGVVYGVIIAFVLIFLLRLLAVCYYNSERGRIAQELLRQVHAERVIDHDSIQEQANQPAMDLEAQIEEQKRDIAEKRLERRECYQEFLKPFTRIVKADDWVDSDSLEDGARDPKTSSCSHPQHLMGRVSQHVLRIPASATTTTTTSAQRSVEPSCAMCLADYEVGDTIVWASEPDCSHVFHHECMMQWVSIGKKRCPVCRNWFVPKTLLQDLKKEMNLANNNNNTNRVTGRVPSVHEDEERSQTRNDHGDAEDGII